MKVLGLDVGTKTIGIAMGNTDHKFTQPICTLARKSVKKDAVQIKIVADQHKVDQIVVGLPLELDGSEGRSAHLARQIADEIHKITQLPTVMWDERYSTVEAECRLREAGKNAVDIKKIIDQVAAMIIIEDWWKGV